VKQRSANEGAIMSLFPVSILIVFLAFGASIIHLNQSARDYYDFVAFLLVIFGTFAVALVNIPWKYKRDLKIAFSRLFFGYKIDFKTCLKNSLDYVSTPWDTSQRLNSTILYQSILKDGFELKSLNIPVEKIEIILNERIHSFLGRQKKIANAIKGLAKYPPAFGLMGTVLGLVNVMTGVSTGSDAKSTALKMAIALVATMYGLLVANLFVNPAGEMIQKYANDDESFAQIAVEAVLLEIHQTSLLEAQEYLNSFAPVESRISLTNNFNEREEPAA
jgi:chemotaxis protein MotA